MSTEHSKSAWVDSRSSSRRGGRFGLNLSGRRGTPVIDGLVGRSGSGSSPAVLGFSGRIISGPFSVRSRSLNNFLWRSPVVWILAYLFAVDGGSLPPALVSAKRAGVLCSDMSAMPSTGAGIRTSAPAGYCWFWCTPVTASSTASTSRLGTVSTIPT